MTPKGSAINVGPNSTTVVTFTVTNSSGGDANFSIACDGSCATSTASLFVSANSNGTFDVTVYAPASGSGTVTVTAANDALGDSDQGSVNYVVHSSAPSVTANAYSVAMPENGNGGVTFHATNGGDTSGPYTLYVSCSGNVSSCSAPSSTASVNPGASTNVTVGLHAGAAGSGNGSVILTATAFSQKQRLLDLIDESVRGKFRTSEATANELRGWEEQSTRRS